LPDSHRNHFSISQIPVVAFPKHGRKNNHAAIVRSGNELLQRIWLNEKNTMIMARRMAAVLDKKIEAV
jgi:hypothetical protein